MGEVALRGAVLRMLEAVGKVPVGRMRDDYTGIECVACKRLGRCRRSCWVRRLMAAADDLEREAFPGVAAEEDPPIAESAKACGKCLHPRDVHHPRIGCTVDGCDCRRVPG